MNKNSPFNISILGGDMPISLFCSPQPPCETTKNSYASKINLQQFERIKRLGANIIYGHNEFIGGKNEKYVFEALEICEQVKLAYFVKDVIAERYVSLGDRGYPPYSSLTEKEKNQLDCEFENSLDRYKNYSAFCGITFFDEPGSDSFAGIRRAKDVFEKVCPNKIFYVNMLPYYVTPEQYQFGYVTKNKTCNIEEYSYAHSNIERYLHFIKLFIKIVEPRVFSYDAYPFVDYGSVTSSVHEVLYEMQQLGHYIDEKYNIPYMPYMQAGGLWEGQKQVRVPSLSEMYLQINVSLGFGASGLQFFPYCYPNDWLEDNNAIAGLVDRHGNCTPMYDIVKTVLDETTVCRKLLLGCALKKMMLVGEFKGGLPSAENLEKIKWSETIFQGVLPKFQNIQVKTLPFIKSASASSQFIISEFDGDTRLLYIVNNSVTNSGDIELEFDKLYKLEVIYKAKNEKKETNNISLCDIQAGQAALVRFI